MVKIFWHTFSDTVYIDVLNSASTFARTESTCYKSQIFDRCLSSVMYAESCVAGKFRFRFWDFGRWRKIAVDDRLPTVKDQNGINQLIFARNSRQRNEFWIPLIEKAFVKYVYAYINVSARCTATFGYFQLVLSNFRSYVTLNLCNGLISRTPGRTVFLLLICFVLVFSSRLSTVD